MNERIKKGIYILPSLFTCGNAAFGLLSIFSSIEGQFINAAWLLVCAMGCDILDGRVARLTRTTSPFGLQLDSLSDLISFGVAPAIMMYMLILDKMDKVGISIAVLYVLCCALRLAKFNVLAIKGVASHQFVGLPTPASAGIIMSFVLSYELIGPQQYSLTFKTIPILMKSMPYFFKAMPVVMVVLSFLMVSNVPYISFKKISLSKPRAIRLLIVIIVLILLLIVYPQNIFFIIFSFYVLSGLIFQVHKIFSKRRKRIKQDNAS